MNQEIILEGSNGRKYVEQRGHLPIEFVHGTTVLSHSNHFSRIFIVDGISS